MQEQTNRRPTPSQRSPAHALRLPPGALPQLHIALDLAPRSKPPTPGEAGAARRFRRWIYRDRAIHARVEHLGGSIVECEVAPRDLSCAGIGLLHNGFFHAGTVVTLTLHSLDREPILVRGVVRWCRHAIRQVHESGVEFDRLIDPRHFLALDNSAESLIYESVAPEELTGAVLHVEPNPAERKLLAHMLRTSGLTVAGVSTLGEALDAISKGHFDVIITEADLPDSGVVEFLGALAERTVRTPVVVLTALSAAALRHVFDDAGLQPALLLNKPFDESLLLCAAAQVLLGNVANAEWASGPIRSRLLSDDSITELVRDFVESLHRDAGVLAECLAANDAARARHVVHMLRSSGASYGFEPVSAAASAVEDAMPADATTLDAVRAEVNRLIEVLRRCVAN